MTRILPMVDARRKLTSLPEELVHDGAVDVVEVTRRGKSVLAVMPWEFYQTLTETLEVLGDAELLAQLRQSLRELERGEVIPWDQARRELLR